MKRSPNPKFYLLMALGTLVAGSVLVFSQASRLGDKRANVERLRQESQDENQVRERLASSATLLEEARVKLEHLEQNIPSAAYIPTMLQELEKVGKEQGIKVVGVRPAMRMIARPKVDGTAAEPIRKPYDELDIEVKGRGSYEAIENFVKSLQSFPKIVAARMVSVSPHIDPLNPTEPQLEIAVELRAYLFKPGEGKKTQEAKA